MKTKVHYIAGGILLGMLPVVVLILNPRLSTNNNSGFGRLFPPHFLMHHAIFDSEINGNYIAGMDSTTIYLGYSNTPLKLGRFQWKQNHFSQSNLKLKDSSHIAWKALKCHVRNQHLYLLEGLTPNIFEGSINSAVLNPKACDAVSFNDVLPITSSQWVIKTIDRQRNQQVLGLLRADGLPIHIPNINLKKQVDGFFCVDGDLNFNEEAQCVIYNYRYRNEFLIFDTNLKFLKASNTIDPNNRAQIKVGSIKTDGKERLQLAAPPPIVNKKSYSQGAWLFINSNIPTKHEDRSQFHSKSVIDIYGLQNGDYKYSFYIPPYKGQLMKDFAYYNNTLAVLYGQGIIIFKMDLTIG